MVVKTPSAHVLCLAASTRYHEPSSRVSRSLLHLVAAHRYMQTLQSTPSTFQSSSKLKEATWLCFTTAARRREVPCLPYGRPLLAAVAVYGRLVSWFIMCCFLADPAAEAFEYPVSIDLRELISLEDVMQELQLGPNG